MNTEQLTEFFTQLFSSLNVTDSWTVLFFLITTFLLGILFAWIARGGKIRRLKKALRKKDEEYKLLHAEMAGLREQFELKEADLKKAQLAADDFQLNLSAAQENNGQLQNQLLERNAKIEELSQTNLSYSSSIEALNNQILGLQSKNSRIETELEQSIVNQQQEEEEISEIKSNYDGTLNRLAMLEQKITLLETENTNLKSELLSLERPTGASNLSNDLDEVKDLLRRLTEENASLKSEIYSIKDTNRVKVVRMAEEEMQSVLARLSQLEAENKNLHTKLNELTNTSTAPIQFVDIEEEEEILLEEDSKERSDRARQAIQEVLGQRIKAATEAEKDDLQNINGIGPFIEEKLNDIGIYTFEQISQLDDELIQLITEAIEFFPGRIQRDDWVGQAKTLFTRS